MPDLIGRTIGKYRVVARLGRGGMAEVYKAYQPGLDRYVAIKVLHSYLSDDPDFIGRFEREARAIANLRHPNIVQIFDFDVEDDLYYMAMEFIDGPTLKAELRERSQQGKIFSLEESARIMAALCDAIDYAHRHGMVHRDLKPANFIINRDGQVLVLDFGIAKIVGATQYTVTGAVAGTPAYMSPEQGQGKRGDNRSDIYSLGVVLYEMMTGRVPFDADTPFAVIMKHISDPLPMPRSIKSDIPVAIERIILKALAKDPDDRYQSALDLATALRDAVGLSMQDTLIRNPVTTLAPTPQVRELTPDDDAFTPLPHRKPPTATRISPTGDTPDTGTVLSPQATPSALPKWLLWGGAALALVIIAGLSGLLLFNGQREKQNNTQATALAQNKLDLAQTVTVQAATTMNSHMFIGTPPPTPTDIPPTATSTPSPTNTPDLDATISARLTATAIEHAVATANAVGLATRNAPTATPTPKPTSTLAPTSTPRPLPPANTPKPVPPTNTPTPTPPPAPKFAGHIAIPIDNGLGRYDVRIFELPAGKEIGEITGARQPFYRNDGALLVNGDTSPTNEGAGTDVFMYNVDGTGGRPISGSPEDGYPSWSPDGGRIAYDNPGLVSVSGSKPEWHLFVQQSLDKPDINQMASFNVIEGNVYDSGQPLHPVWASDDYLIFRACDIWPGGRGGTKCAIWRTPSWATSGGTGYTVPQLVSNLNGIPTDTEGGSLLVMSRETGNWDVYITGIAGGGETNLTNNPAQDGLGTFSPDGKWVAFVSDRAGWAVWAVPSSGGDAVKLFDLPGPPWGRGEHDWTLERISWGP